MLWFRVKGCVVHDLGVSSFILADAFDHEV